MKTTTRLRGGKAEARQVRFRYDDDDRGNDRDDDRSTASRRLTAYHEKRDDDRDWSPPEPRRAVPQRDGRRPRPAMPIC